MISEKVKKENYEHIQLNPFNHSEYVSPQTKLPALDIALKLAQRLPKLNEIPVNQCFFSSIENLYTFNSKSCPRTSDFTCEYFTNTLCLSSNI